MDGTFAVSDPTTPISWLYFLGQWGDEQYPDSDPRQVNFYNLNITWKYESGPTGPLDKGLNRTDTCPDQAGVTCTTLSVLPATSGTSVPVTVVRSITSHLLSSTSVSMTSTAGGSSSSSSSTAKSDARRPGLNTALILFAVVVLFTT